MENTRSQCRRLQGGRVVYVAKVLVVIRYNVLVVISGFTRSVVVKWYEGKPVQSDEVIYV